LGSAAVAVLGSAAVAVLGSETGGIGLGGFGGAGRDRCGARAPGGYNENELGISCADTRGVRRAECVSKPS
jgi:hypothetical protein